MAYNRKNLLLKIVEIQNTTLEMKAKGAFQKWIYDNIIRDRYHISNRTFNKYLTINAKRELKELNKAERVD